MCSWRPAGPPLPERGGSSRDAAVGTLPRQEPLAPAATHPSPPAVNDFWETRHRKLTQQYEKLAHRLSGEETPGQTLIEEQTVRLLTGAVMLLQHHKMDKRGRCRACATLGRIWRFWLRRPPCAVYRDLNFAMSQGIDAVWWQLLAGTGRPASLDEVRKWLPEWERSTASRRDHKTPE